MDSTLINAVGTKHFNTAPKQIIKKKIGLCNEVYELKYDAESYILRMNTHKDNIYGTHKHLPIFQKLAIKTPQTIAEDYSMEELPFCYQIQTKLDGQDLGLVINQLNESELKNIAQEISIIFDKFNSLPNTPEFYQQIGINYSADLDIFKGVKKRRDHLLERNQKVQILDQEVIDIYNNILIAYSSYFEQIKPKLFYDDINYKNVMINEGQFNGIVDLDFLAIGDYLDAIGAMQACWFGEHKGSLYLNEIIQLQKLNKQQKAMINVYAILHLILWSMEEGVKFNANTSGEINWENVKKKRQKIIELYKLVP